MLRHAQRIGQGHIAGEWIEISTGEHHRVSGRG
ncbi:hypothetical protein MnTg03_00154 [bacterium MnTg03]|nr:hypothetical protein MnTg03_00154 [bacterium MnTg03]